MSFTSFFAFSPWTDELRDDTGLKLAAVHIVSCASSSARCARSPGFARVENLTELTYHHHTPADVAADAWQCPGEETVVRRAANSPASGGNRDLYLRGFAGEVAHFLECVSASRTPTSSAADNVATMALCDDILRSLRRP